MNSANKLFALSKYQPVAIAIYGNAEFIGTPWEIIIKEYRQSLKEKSFNSIRLYVDDFQKFLKRKKYYCTDSEANEYLRFSVKEFLGQLLEICKKEPEKADYMLSNLEQKKSQKLLGGFTQKTVGFFKSLVQEDIKEEFRKFQKENIPISFSRLENATEAVFTHDVVPLGTTGLVFAGYGSSEVFPSVFNCTVGNVIDGLLAKSVKKSSRIDKNNYSGICPFAQTDVMRTILDGVSPKMQNVYLSSLEQTFTKMKNALASIISSSNDSLAKQIKELDITPFRKEFLQLSRTIQLKEYTTPFINSVGTLEKEDLADFAESLITLTSLKRKVSYDQETVGGPVDVMVISKGDGIIWMKRKNYFDAKKNHQFLDNYYNF